MGGERGREGGRGVGREGREEGEEEGRGKVTSSSPSFRTRGGEGGGEEGRKVATAAAYYARALAGLKDLETIAHTSMFECGEVGFPSVSSLPLVSSLPPLLSVESSHSE